MSSQTAMTSVSLTDRGESLTDRGESSPKEHDHSASLALILIQYIDTVQIRMVVAS